MKHKHKRPEVSPQIFKHLVHAAHEELAAFMSLFRFYWPLVIVFLLGLGTLLYVARPMPPKQLRIATGQPNSSLDLLGRAYAESFKKHGVTLELVKTAGALENVELIKQGKVDAAFSLGGLVTQDEVPGVVSLGSVEYQPFWMFYRGAQYDGSNPVEFFKGKTFSINIPGSGTRNLTEKILSLHGIRVVDNPSFVSISSSQSVEALRAGKIDGFFLLAGIESKTIQSLVNDPGVHVFNFVSAQAYSKYFNFLEPLTMPRGGFNLVADVPRQDTQMVASTTTILTTNALHPALQQLFLSSTKAQAQGAGAFFSRAGGFPARVDHNLPISKVAQRFYSSGAPALEGHLPFWMSSFFDQIWFILLALVAVGYPLVKVFPNYRKVYAKFCIEDCFDELKSVDMLLMDHNTSMDLQKKLDHFDALERKVDHLWIPMGVRDDFYSLKNAVEIVRLKAERHKEKLDLAPLPLA